MPRCELTQVRGEVRRLANPRAAATLRRFFKTGRGEYGEGDRFLGVKVPPLRLLARMHRDLPRAQVLMLLRSRWHEERLLAVLILVSQYKRASVRDRGMIYRLYRSNTRYINNWDLVDLSAEHIIGAHLDPRRLAVLERMARSRVLWERRVAVLATFHWIKQGIFGPTLRIAELLLDDPHDLIHKGVGWMLREVGKRDLSCEEAFLRAHHRRMPRIMLRYAIERFPERRRQAWLTA
jgi:3-methyladenine DNA glycosylase AlkD